MHDPLGNLIFLSHLFYRVRRCFGLNCRLLLHSQGQFGKQVRWLFFFHLVFQARLKFESQILITLLFFLPFIYALAVCEDLIRLKMPDNTLSHGIFFNGVQVGLAKVMGLFNG